MSKNVRVRFAPSPTGGLHLGGVRTALFNYLFAKQHNGTFVLRTEDTDQTRFVSGAEDYIFNCLAWCGISPDESTQHGGPFAPYRQSERKPLYRQYAEQLVAAGQAYYAFDTPEQLDAMRKDFATAENPSPQYGHQVRQRMRNSLSLPEAETAQLLADGVPHVIRIKMPANETIAFTDLIRGDVSFDSNLVDDKVLLKADGMPTYHLAVVVDDALMEITHAFRGEEWLPSAPVHILLWEYLFGRDRMPQWAHLPLILKPDGNGKLSKRDSERLGFPIFAMDWTDPRTQEKTTGFRERGFLPEAFVNMLALLGWHSSSGQELFSLEELVQEFSIDKVAKGGAKFDFEKAKWFNQEWLKRLPVQQWAGRVQEDFAARGIAIPDTNRFVEVLEMVKDRCSLLTDFYTQAAYFYQAPQAPDTASIRPKWEEKKTQFFRQLIHQYELLDNWESAFLESVFKELAAAEQIKPGELMLPFRIMLVGGKFGPAVFDIAQFIGRADTVARIKHTLELLSQ
jgi:glutamyl-tRNA synthetase